MPHAGTVAAVLAGGIALGAFEAGALAALDGEPAPTWVLGASIGAVNAGIWAGNAPGQRAAQLRAFWQAVTSDLLPLSTLLFGPPPESGAWRVAYSQAAAMQTLLLGRPGLFRPRLAPGPAVGEAPALYDLAPLADRLAEHVDFERLNSGACRVTVVATDVIGGGRVVFDTARGTSLGPRHLAASCALLPLFAPLEVDGRLLGDGGLASNAPVDLVLDDPATDDVICLLVELFAPSGQRPQTLGASVSRSLDLTFGNQTERQIESRAHTLKLRAAVRRLGATLTPQQRTTPGIAELLRDAERGPRRTTVLRLGYHAGLDEAGPAKLFDFSRVTLSDRWQAGERAMRAALDRLAQPPSPSADLAFADVTG